jgi:integrase
VTETKRRDFVQAVNAPNGKTYLYYRREGRQQKLRGPEWSAAFLADYARVHDEFEGKASAFGRHTVGAAISEWKASEMVDKSKSTQRLYGIYLNELQAKAGDVSLLSVDIAWAKGLRSRLSDDAHRWNRIRSLMAAVTDSYVENHEKELPPFRNPWRIVKKLGVEQSTQNRPWPAEVLVEVLREATPEFRALVTVCLMTAQRIGDVVLLAEDQYDPATRRWAFQQGKTGRRMKLRIGDALADAFDAMRGRVPGRLLCTPRGFAWTKLNAEETLLSLRARLSLDRYTLHGLRSTGPSAARQQGASLQVLMALTGHTTERNLRIYLRGIDDEAFAAEAGEMVEGIFAPVISAALEGANTRSYSGVTGKAAAKASVVGSARRKAAGGSQ